MSVVFNGVLRFMSGVRIHDMNCPLRVMRRELAARLNLYGSLFRYIPYFFARQNARIVEVAVENRARRYGVSKYTFSKYPVAVADFITVAFVTHYEQRPLHFFGRLGLVAFAFGVAIDAALTLMWLTGGERIDENVPSLLLGILFIVIGILFMTTGLLGELTVRTANRSMPYYRTYVETVVGGDRRDS
jgi:dolichol-phosphate mannosyltransferase